MEGSVSLSPLEKKCNKLTKLLRHDFLGEELGTSIMDYDEEEDEENDPHLMLNASKVVFYPIFIDMSLEKDLPSPSPRRQPLARNGPHQHLPNGIYLLKKEGLTFPSFP